MSTVIGRCCRLILLCAVLLISVISAEVHGEFRSCTGWRLNHLPEVKRFLKEVRVPIVLEKQAVKCCDTETQKSFSDLSRYDRSVFSHRVISFRNISALNFSRYLTLPTFNSLIIHFSHFYTSPSLAKQMNITFLSSGYLGTFPS